MSELELQQVICPSCKKVITSFNPFKAEVECPFCHNKAFNPLITAKKVPIPERLIVFKTSEQDFERSLINRLIETDYVPTDIFESINPGSVFKAYLPMYLYEGKYQASWNCSVAYKTTELRASSDGKSVKNKTVTKWQPASGMSNGNFAFLCLAYEGNDIPDELKRFTSQFPYNVMFSKEYDPELLGLDNGENCATLALNADSDLVWNKYGDGLVNELAEQSASQQLSGQDIKDFRTSANYDLKTNGRYVLAPFWFVYYVYNNEKHYFIMDGLGENESMSTPINQAEVEFVKSKESIKNIVKWLWLITFLVMFSIGFTWAIGYLGLWFVSKLIVNKIMDNKIQQQLNDSRAKRRELAARLGI